MSGHKPFNFSAWRKRVGWTTAQAATGLGVSRNTYGGWENGKPQQHAFATSHLCESIEWYLTHPGDVDHFRSLKNAIVDQWLSSIERFINRAVEHGNHKRGRPRKVTP